MRLFWLWSGAAAVLIRIVFGFFPTLTEKLYTTFLFSSIRVALDTLWGWGAFPKVYIIVAIFIGSLLFFLVKNIWAQPNFLSRLRALGSTLLVYGCFLVATFLWLWGFNYARPEFRTLIQLPKTTFSNEALAQEFEASTQNITQLRAQFDAFQYLFQENSIKNEVKSAMQLLQLTPTGNPRARLLYAGTLLHFNTSGVYFPWTGECNIDAGLHTLQQPFTLAHELAHGFGVTDEGACNFIAYIACHNSQNLYIKYSGELSYWRYVAANMKAIFPEKYKVSRENLSPAIKNDLLAIKKNMDEYADWLPVLQPLMYDTFLKSQGVKAGMLSYSEILLLVHDWKIKNEK
jgi:Protein of unknown function (DUF3810)